LHGGTVAKQLQVQRGVLAQTCQRRWQGDGDTVVTTHAINRNGDCHIKAINLIELNERLTL
jgi:hypothetical protein